MRHLFRSITMILFGLIIFLSSCKKDKNYPKNSVFGPWHCMEQGAVYEFRQYDVSIDYQGGDSSLIVIYNFYNLGFNVETFATIDDTIITIIGVDLGANVMHDISGSGHIKRDFSEIHWTFNYFGNQPDNNVEALYRRP